MSTSERNARPRRHADIRKDERTPFALGVLAEELRDRGKFAESEACYRRAVELAEAQKVTGKSLADMKIALAQVLAAQQKLSKAEQCLREAMDLASGDSGHPCVWQSAKDELNEIAGKRRRRRNRIGLVAASLMVCVGVTLAVFEVPELVRELVREKAKNEILTIQAFAAYEQGDFKSAKERAEDCIKEFKGDAERLQIELTSEGAGEPPLGSVNSSIRRGIHRNGLLNDVATCWWLKGRCAEKLGQSDEARQAFQEAKKLTYARCWDPKIEIFWSPALKAGDDLENLDDALLK